ncbi:MAG TPA: hypothetical protein VF980_11325 [Thermoanaerobaculia bacterium]
MKGIIFVVLLAAPLSAQQTAAVFPTFALTGGGYSGEMTTDIRLDPLTTGLPPGTTVNLERDLGLQTTNNIHRFTAEWRPFARHELDASYFSARRTGFRNIDQVITFGDVSFPVQAAVSTQMKLQFADVDYTYWAHKTPTNGFGLMLGVSSIKIDAQAAARRPGEIEISLRQNASTDVPVPVIGAQLRQAFTRRLLGEIRGAVLPNVKVQNIKADARTANASLEYRLADFVGVGVAYNYFNLSGDVTQNAFLGTLHMTVRGVEGYVRVALGTH